MARRFWTDIQGEKVLSGSLNLGLTLFVMVSVGFIVLLAASRWVAVVMGVVKPRSE